MKNLSLYKLFLKKGLSCFKNAVVRTIRLKYKYCSLLFVQVVPIWYCITVLLYCIKIHYYAVPVAKHTTIRLLTKSDDEEAATATSATREGKDCVGVNDMKLMWEKSKEDGVRPVAREVQVIIILYDWCYSYSYSYSFFTNKWKRYSPDRDTMLSMYTFWWTSCHI